MDLKYPPWTFALIGIVAMFVPGIARGADCPRSGYYGIPQFGTQCQYRCRCVNEDQCDRQTGSCVNGCALGWMGPGCQYRNIATLGNGIYHLDGDPLKPAGLASDGNNRTCSKSYRTVTSDAWWKIQFDRSYYLVGLTIVFPELQGDRPTGFKVEGVSSSATSVCYEHPDTTSVPRSLEIMCKSDMVIDIIRIVTSPSSRSLELCQVEIYGGRYVSYKAQTEHSSYFAPWVGVSNKSVDGRPMLDGDEQERDAERTCSSTNRNWEGFWRAFFFDELLVEALNVYGRRLPDNPERNSQIQMFSAYVISNNRLKHIFTDNPVGPGWEDYQPRRIQLSAPVSGTGLEIRKRPDTYDHLSLCEVEIFAGCNLGRCGWDCSDVCQCSSPTTGIYRLTGVCPYGCQQRWMGTNGRCNVSCPYYTWGETCTNYCHCFNGVTCDFITGQCPNGCAPGWKPTVSCNTTCDAYTYGIDCNQKCGHCGDNASCNATTGYCPGICQPGWRGDLCKSPCGDYYYGAGCSLRCGECRHNSQCKKDTGHCETGCSVGLLPPLCKEECPNGSYGDQCSGSCGNCRGGVPCNKISGNCPGECDPGWKGAFCNEACDDFTFGLGCSKVCGHCSGSAPCQKDTGVCLDGCGSGFKGSECTETCSNFTYGANCIHQCGLCRNKEECNITTGYCSNGCEPGRSEPFCQAQRLQEPSSNSSPVSIIVPVVVVVVVGILAAVFIVLFVRRRRSKRNTKMEDKSELGAIHLDNGVSKEHTAMPPASPIDTGNQDETADNVYINSSALSEPIPISELGAYCRKVKLDPSSPYDSFKDLPHGLQFSTNEALREENRSKNRYKDLYPYDKNIAVLPKMPGVSHSDYINASLVDGYALPKRYIAAQGAVKNTVIDIWRMIWAYDVATVVMLTACFEQGKHKCEQYWPAEDSQQYGDIHVTVEQVDTYAEHTIRRFRIQKKDCSEAKRTTQYHFTGWPDKDVPDDTLSLVQFWKIVKNSERAAASPWMVHCSAGIGRTGTFIAIDYLYDQGATENVVDVKRCVHQLRDQRVNMVQTKDQYLFVHLAVNETVNPIGTYVQTEQFIQKWHDLQNATDCSSKDKLFHEYKMMSADLEDCPEGHEYATFNAFLSDDEYSDSGTPDNLKKSRSPDILPPNRYRPMLSLPVEGHSDYINAVKISSYRMKDGLILSQAPLASTVIDCVRLIWQYKITTVVIMEKSYPEEAVYWPDSEESSIKVGPFSVQLVAHTSGDGITTRKLLIQLAKSDEVLELQQFHVHFWEEGATVPGASGIMLTLVSKVETWCRTSGSGSSILVHCLDGATQSGLFCVLWSVLERIKSDRIVAVAETVRLMRVRRKQLIPSYEQYLFCWTTIKEYIDGGEVYGNVM